MNVIDLRNHLYTGDNIILEKEDYFIFHSVEKVGNNYIREFYKYDFKNNIEIKINKSSIETSEEACYSNYVKDNILYTTSYIENDNNVDCVIWRLDLESGDIEELLRTSGNKEIYFINSKYLIAKDNKFGKNNNYMDEKELAIGKYDFAELIDLETKEKYLIKDKKIVWKLNENIYTFEANKEINVFLEDSYLDTWELQDAFSLGIKKEHIYKEGYKESLNIMKLEDFIDEIKKGKDELNFKVIAETNYKESVRYFGKNDNFIFYRKCNFEDNKMNIYKYDINTGEIINEDTIDLSPYVYRGLYYSNDEQKVFYEDNFSEKITISEITEGSLKVELDEEYEEYANLLENRYLVTNLCEEEDEDNVRYYVKIKDLNKNEVKVFEGFCEFPKNRIVLFA